MTSGCLRSGPHTSWCQWRCIACTGLCCGSATAMSRCGVVGIGAGTHRTSIHWRVKTMVFRTNISLYSYPLMIKINCFFLATLHSFLDFGHGCWAIEVLYPPKKVLHSSFFVGCQMSMPFNAFLRTDSIYICMSYTYIIYRFFLVVSIVLEACL